MNQCPDLTETRTREALLYKHREGKVQCHTCERRCLIPEGKLGFCATRKNICGRLYTLEYGDISSISANPIEKKPLFHFYPGTKALTIGSWSCNFTCPWCQNYDISKSPHNTGKGCYISPETFIELIEKCHCQGTSVSFNEPTLLLEYSLDIFELAKKAGYYNTYVTNGYMTEQALELLATHGLDAMNIDIKGDTEVVRRFCSADIDIVWRNAILAKKQGVWIELTTLIIPGVNDTEEGLRSIARRIKSELGKDIPWHLNGYHPAYNFHAPATPFSTLEKARSIGKAEGLKYLYIGNMPLNPYENTYCPGCNQALIERHSFSITRYQISKDKRCPHCGEEIPVIGNYA